MSIKVMVGATIEGLYGAKEDYKPSKAVKARAEELGLKALVKKGEDVEPNEVHKALEKSVWNLSKNIKKHRRGYKQKDFINALNFLEVFCMYASQSGYLHKPSFPKDEERNYDAPTIKAVQKIEDMVQLLQSGSLSKKEKIILRKQVTTLNVLVDKLFTRKLTLTEQIAVAKVVTRAEEILKKI